jgi:hypothetical protein
MRERISPRISPGVAIHSESERFVPNHLSSGQCLELASVTNASADCTRGQTHKNRCLTCARRRIAKTRSAQRSDWSGRRTRPTRHARLWRIAVARACRRDGCGRSRWRRISSRKRRKAEESLRPGSPFPGHALSHTAVESEHSCVSVGPRTHHENGNGRAAMNNVVRTPKVLVVFVSVLTHAASRIRSDRRERASRLRAGFDGDTKAPQSTISRHRHFCCAFGTLLRESSTLFWRHVPCAWQHLSLVLAS